MNFRTVPAPVLLIRNALGGCLPHQTCDDVSMVNKKRSSLFHLSQLQCYLRMMNVHFFCFSLSDNCRSAKYGLYVSKLAARRHYRKHYLYDMAEIERDLRLYLEAREKILQVANSTLSLIRVTPIKDFRELLPVASRSRNHIPKLCIRAMVRKFCVSERNWHWTGTKICRSLISDVSEGRIQVSFEFLESFSNFCFVGDDVKSRIDLTSGDLQSI